MSQQDNRSGARRVGVAQTAQTLALFFATWLLWSGHYVPLVITLGVISCVLVLGLARRAGFFEDDLYALHLGPRLPRYWMWLLAEITRANFAVARIILNPRMTVSPCLTHIDASDLPPVVQATLANAITLTPGTLTTDVDQGHIEVHCLTREIAAQLEQGEMRARAGKLSGT